MRISLTLLALAVAAPCLTASWSASSLAGLVAAPRIESVVPLEGQPQATAATCIFFDDFDGEPKPYTESQGGLDEQVAFGNRGRSMVCLYEQGQRGVGNRKVFFGDAPTGTVLRKGESFQDVYWRIYVRHQEGWTGGGPAKMSRATSIVSPRWNQAMILHVWSSGEALTLDPASGVRGDAVVTTRYNDFPRLKWLGNKPVSQFPISSTAEAGWWVCVEARAKLNTPGQADGVAQLWIDGRLAAQRENMNFRGGYDGHGINAVFLESYWNSGSPVTQRRWYDNFVIATEPIGPVLCPVNPTLLKTAWRGEGKPGAWEVQLTADAEGKTVVWQSEPITAGDRVRVDASTGRFVADLSGKTGLAAGRIYWARVRQQVQGGSWSEWSPWHQAFGVAEARR